MTDHAATIFFVVMLLIFVIACAKFLKAQKELVADYEARLAENRDLRAQLSAANLQRQHSLELTEFLKDQSQYGFSFTRVDPAAVTFTRSQGRAE